MINDTKPAQKLEFAQHGVLFPQPSQSLKMLPNVKSTTFKNCKQNPASPQVSVGASSPVITRNHLLWRAKIPYTRQNAGLVRMRIQACYIFVIVWKLVWGFDWGKRVLKFLQIAEVGG